MNLCLIPSVQAANSCPMQIDVIVYLLRSVADW